MEATFNKIKEISERSKLELLGCLHQAAEELNAKARAKDLTVEHTFDFKTLGGMEFYISVFTKELVELYAKYTSYQNTVKLIGSLQAANEIIDSYKMEGE